MPWVRNVAVPTVRSAVQKNVRNARTVSAVARAVRVRNQKTAVAEKASVTAYGAGALLRTAK